jgi:DNA-binding PucR family transcriptional regulator
VYTGQKNGTERAALATACVESVAAALNNRLAALVSEMLERLSADVDQLRGDDRLIKLLGASIEGNVDTALHILQHGIAVDRVEVPPAAVEYARRLAQHGVPVRALARAYRLGHDTFLQRGFQELGRQVDDPDLMADAAQQLAAIAFSYVDRVTEQVLEAYEDERERWLRQRNAAREARVHELLRGDRVDIATVEATLGYQLTNQRHLGLVVWLAHEPQDSGVAQLERFIRGMAEHLACPAVPLFLPYDQATGWAWLPVGCTTPEGPQLRAAAEAADPDVRVAAGCPGAGIAGFRRSHQQALQVQTGALAAGSGAHSVATFIEVGPIALMSNDMAATRLWVAETLGRLALDDEQHARLRETLRVFLAGGGSYTSAAQELALHRNSVYYRVRKAEEERGQPIGSDRLSVEIALEACRWLGEGVLTRTT